MNSTTTYHVSIDYGAARKIVEIVATEDTVIAEAEAARDRIADRYNVACSIGMIEVAK